MRFNLTFAVFSFLMYLALTAGRGSIVLWSPIEIGVGIVIAILIGLISSSLPRHPSMKALNPIRWLKFGVYLILFFIQMAKSNIDVAIRVITGHVNPGIVKVPSKQKTQTGLVLLANSITLTPGTLTIDTDKDYNLYIHWIDVKKKHPDVEDVADGLPKLVRWIME